MSFIAWAGLLSRYYAAGAGRAPSHGYCSVRTFLRPCSSHHTSVLRNVPSKHPRPESSFSYTMFHCRLSFLVPSRKVAAFSLFLATTLQREKWNSKRSFYVKRLASRCLAPLVNCLLLLNVRLGGSALKRLPSLRA